MRSAFLGFLMEKTLLKFLIREQSTRQKVQRLKMINFNTRSSITVKPLSDKNPRQALCYCINILRGRRNLCNNKINSNCGNSIEDQWEKQIPSPNLSFSPNFSLFSIWEDSNPITSMKLYFWSSPRFFSFPSPKLWITYLCI